MAAGSISTHGRPRAEHAHISPFSRRPPGPAATRAVIPCGPFPAPVRTALPALGLLLAAVVLVSGFALAAPRPVGPAGSLTLTLTGPTTVPLGEAVEYRAQVTGGNGPYEFNWSVNGTRVAANLSVGLVANASYSFRPLGDGIYLLSVLVTDSGGNQSAQSAIVTVSGPGPIQARLVLLRAGSNGSLLLHAQASGGTPPYRYRFTGPGAPGGVVSDANWTTAALPAGVYNFSVVVQDAFGYSTVARLTVHRSIASSASSFPWYLWVGAGAAIAFVAMFATLFVLRRRGRPPGSPRDGPPAETHPGPDRPR